MLFFKLLKIKVILCLVSLDLVIGQNTITIDTKLGKIMGLEDRTVIDNEPYFSFRRIPYAEARIGEQRFDPPKLNNISWSGIFNGTNDLPLCPQYRFDTELVWRGDADCLYMNVYTPCTELRNHQNITTKYPVIVFINGGGFNSNVANEGNFGPDYLVPHGVIFVTFNYRLGPFGFLNMYTKNALGNNGLKDQVVALQWVKQNIADYCGDPDQVTLFGYGAGGKMIQYHAYSPLSKGLYHRSIQDSSYGTQRAAVLKPREVAFALGQELGIYTNDPDELFNQLKKIPTQKIVNAGNVINLRRNRDRTDNNFNAWTPSVEAPIEGVESDRFLVDFPDTSSKTGPINEMPYLLGSNKEEGAIYVESSFRCTPEWVETHMDRMIPFDVNITDPERRKEISNKLAQFYFYKNGTFDGSHANLIELYSDAYYHAPLQVVATLRAARAKSSVFRYLFTFKSSDSLFRQHYPVGAAASHFDELEYLLYFRPFTIHLLPQPNTHQMALMRSFSEMWTNFAKYGDPVQQKQINVPVDRWNPMKKDDYLDIDFNDSVQLTNRRGFLKERMKFWIRNIYIDYIQDVKEYFSEYFDEEDDNTDDMNE